MSIDPLKLMLKLLSPLAYWANYKVRFTGPEEFTLPLGLVVMLAAALLLLILYTVWQVKKRE